MFKLFLDIILSPSKAWKAFDLSCVSQKRVLLQFLLPLLGVTSVLTFLGVLRIPGNTFLVALQYLLFSFGSGFLGVAISAYFVAKLSASFKGDGSILNSLVVVSFSLAVFIIMSTLGKVIPSLGLIFGLLGLWGIYIFVAGIKPILSMQGERIAGFSLISLLVITLVFFLVYIVLGLFLKIPVNL